jgi:hypothetical protein
MATILDKDLSPKGYPWDEWSNGQTYRIEHGVDFFCSTVSMIANLKRCANREGVDVVCYLTGPSIEFQFSKK